MRAVSIIHLKILFFSDTHLGYDHPINPRVQRSRRGSDFFDNYHHILDWALANKVDLIVHGGDVFFKSRVAPAIVNLSYEPLLEVANAGIPIYLVPGNHERSRLPEHLWLTHQNIRVFDRPRTYLQTVRNGVIALSGFPFMRNSAASYRALISQTGYQQTEADLRFLCLHQTFEGARVGPKNFTFKAGPDNIPGSQTPDVFNAVLSGHIHRGQRLTQTLDGERLAVPIIYPGSVERTSFAERYENKYFVLIEIHQNDQETILETQYQQLPARPMLELEISTIGLDLADFALKIHQEVSQLSPDSIVRIQVTGPGAEEYRKSLPPANLRKIGPGTMNISMNYPRDLHRQARG